MGLPTDLRAHMSDYYSRSCAYTQRMAGKAGQFWERKFADYVQTVAQSAGDAPARILDLGCGGGLTTHLLSQRGYRVIGLDISFMTLINSAVPEAESLSLVNSDSLCLPFPDGIFDVVASNAMLEHLPDAHAALCEMIRVLSNKGILVVFAPNMLSPIRSLRLFAQGLKNGRMHPDGHPTSIVQVIKLLWRKVNQKQLEFIYRRPLMAGLEFPGSDYDAVCLVNPFDMIGFAKRYGLRVRKVVGGTSNLGKLVARIFPWFAGGVQFVAQKA